jgi:hypothetical protein
MMRHNKALRGSPPPSPAAGQSGTASGFTGTAFDGRNDGISAPPTMPIEKIQSRALASLFQCSTCSGVSIDPYINSNILAPL